MLYVGALGLLEIANGCCKLAHRAFVIGNREVRCRLIQNVSNATARCEIRSTHFWRSWQSHTLPLCFDSSG